MSQTLEVAADAATYDSINIQINYMEDDTRHLLRLLSSEHTEKLIDALRSEPAGEADLLEHVDESQPSLNRRLRELQLWGIVGTAAPERRSKPGPPTTRWALLGEEIFRFWNTVDAFALGQIELRRDRMASAIEQRRGTQIATAEQETH